MSDGEFFFFSLLSFSLGVLVCFAVTHGTVNNAWEQELIEDGQAVWAVDPISGETTLEYTHPIEESDDE